jgi:hypothetical protein
MSEKFTPEPEVKETITSLNNFYLYLPGGYYRERYGKNPKKDAIMDAIDGLLATEFISLDVKAIFNGKKELDEMVQNIFKAHKGGEELDMEALEKQEQEIRTRSKEADLIPLFKRLVAMGFDPVLLKQ